MPAPLSIGICQLDISWEKPEVNMIKVEKLLSAQPGLDLLVLPEMWTTGFTMDTSHAEAAPGPALQWMKDKAATYNIHIAGSVAVTEDRSCFNRFYIVSPVGEVHSYDKRHLFSYGNENQYYTPGREKMIFYLNQWRIRPIICYDLRFPAWCRYTDDYDILLVVANWPAARIHHWDALLPARAIENQSYVVAVNRAGTDGNNLHYPGHSRVYDMNGSVLWAMDESREVLEKVVLDKNALLDFRAQYPFLQDRDRFTL